MDMNGFDHHHQLHHVVDEFIGPDDGGNSVDFSDGTDNGNCTASTQPKLPSMRSMRYQCSSCDMQFLTKDGKESHERKLHSSHGDPKIPTGANSGSAQHTAQHSQENASSASKHLNGDGDQKKFRCFFCQIRFRMRDTLQVHLQRLHGKTIRENQELSMQKILPLPSNNNSYPDALPYFQPMGRLQRVNQDISTTVYLCSNCAVVFFSKHELEIHKLSCQPPPPPTRRPNILSRTKSAVNSKPKYQCSACPDIVPFQTQNGLRNHEQNFHFNEPVNLEVGIVPQIISVTGSQSLPVYLVDTPGPQSFHAMLNSNSISAIPEDKHMDSDEDVTIIEELVRSPKCQSQPQSKSTVSVTDNPRKTANICPVCGTSFSSKKALQSHTFNYHKFPELKCPNCRLSFYDKLEYEKHLSTHTTLFLELECRFCEGKTQCKDTLKRHLGDVHGKTLADNDAAKPFSSYLYPVATASSQDARKIRCSSCKKNFDSEDSLKIHQRHCSERYRHKCSFCPNKFLSIHGRTMHIRRMHPKESENSSATDESVPKITAVWGSVRTELDELTSDVGFQEEAAGSPFQATAYQRSQFDMSVSVPEIHPEVVTVTESEQDVADDGDKRSVAKDPLAFEVDLVFVSDSESEVEITNEIKPRNISTDRVPVRFNCLYCKKTSSTRMGLKIHSEKVHASEMKTIPNKPKSIPTDLAPVLFNCLYCKKTSSTRIGLKMHSEKMHANEKKIKCFMCDQMFFTEMDCKEHSETHTESFPVKCPKCPAAFRLKDKESYESHLALHTDVCKSKLRKCKLCPRKFLYKIAWNAHMKKMHPRPEKEEEKICAICNSKFGTASELKLHQQKRRKKPFKCSLCPARFKSKCLVQTHKKLHFKLRSQMSRVQSRRRAMADDEEENSGPFLDPETGLFVTPADQISV